MTRYFNTTMSRPVRHIKAPNPAMNGAKVWTEPMVDDLKRLCLTLMSYSEMAGEISGLYPLCPKTRNAVLGKAYRLGLRSDKPQVPKKAVQRRVRKTAAKPRKIKHSERTIPTTGLAPVVFDGASPLLRHEGDLGRTNGHSRRLSSTDPALVDRKLGNIPCIVERNPLSSMPVADVEKDACQWPTSNDIACMEVCGSEAKIGAYCERHAQVAYRVMPTAKRNRSYGKIDVEHEKRIDRHPMAMTFD